mmetsp:Transcript_34498/g.78748  ORF Transcript_34498/g.78748 Transcript_34498/m.78748 type:complete len:640 (+) Transcript_34498:35-1954(+)
MGWVTFNQDEGERAGRELLGLLHTQFLRKDETLSTWCQETHNWLQASHEDGATASTDVSDNEQLAIIDDDDSACWQFGTDVHQWKGHAMQVYFDADEIQTGPDGVLYDISYLGPEEMALELTHAVNAEESCLELDDPRMTSPSAREWLEVSAASSVENMLASIHQGNQRRLPKRVSLFNSVNDAVVEALGAHLQRLALVGSTALRIETPASDLDVVVYTKAVYPVDNADVDCVPPPSAGEVLQNIAVAIVQRDRSLLVQLIDTARVPVLVIRTSDKEVSLDLTVDRPAAEWHVLWFQSQNSSLRRLEYPTALAGMPNEGPEDDSFVASVLRIVKWWLRRRKLPTAKEGGYPSIVWTLMVLHVLRCSIVVGERDERGRPRRRGEAVLTALAAFFDRFSGEDSLSGTLLFADGTHSEFRPELGTDLSVLDPTFTASIPFDAHSAQLAPRLSPATQLLHAYELCRARLLSQAALAELHSELPSDDHGVAKFEAVFKEVGCEMNYVPHAPDCNGQAAIFFSHDALYLGLLRKVESRFSWCEPFLHRRDASSLIEAQLCEVELETGIVSPLWKRNAPVRITFHPQHFVCLAAVQACQETYGDASMLMDSEALARWQAMSEIVQQHQINCDWRKECQQPSRLRAR